MAIPGGRGFVEPGRTRSFGPLATLTVDMLFRVPDDDADDGDDRRVMGSVVKGEMEGGRVVVRNGVGGYVRALDIVDPGEGF